MQELCALRQEFALDPLVQGHIGAAEAIDGLLRVADDEQFAGLAANLTVVSCVGRVAG